MINFNDPDEVPYALAPTDAAHVNETPKSEHDAGNMLTDAAQAPAEDAHVKGETTGQMLERLGMDGVKWAAEFRTTALRLGYSDMDEGWLIGWFCNAIMAGYDRSAAQAREAAMQELIDAYEDIIDYGPLVLAKKDQWKRVEAAKEKLK